MPVLAQSGRCTLAPFADEIQPERFSAGMDDLLAFFGRLPNMNKQFSVMAGISHASFQQKNYMMVYQILHAFYTLQEPVYKG